MANISTDFSTWSTTAGSNQPDSSDTNTIQADLQAIQAGVKGAFPNVGGAVTPTHTELNYVDGVTSAIQTQLDAKAALAGASFTGLVNVNDGADIASATTTDLTAATGNTVRITGTTAITAFTMNAGQQMELVAVGALPLTYDATTMNINGGVSYTCAAGDRLSVFKDGAGVIRVNVIKQDGTPVTAGADASTTVKGIVELATAAEVQTGTDTVRAITPAGLAASSLGMGQTWQDVKASRAVTTNYTNSTGRTIAICLAQVSTGNQTIIVSSATIAQQTMLSTTTSSITVLIPNGAVYSVTGNLPTTWFEFR